MFAELAVLDEQGLHHEVLEIDIPQAQVTHQPPYMQFCLC